MPLIHLNIAPLDPDPDWEPAMPVSNAVRLACGAAEGLWTRPRVPTLVTCPTCVQAFPEDAPRLYVCPEALDVMRCVPLSGSLETLDAAWTEDQVRQRFSLPDDAWEIVTLYLEFHGWVHWASLCGWAPDGWEDSVALRDYFSASVSALGVCWLAGVLGEER